MHSGSCSHKYSKVYNTRQDSLFSQETNTRKIKIFFLEYKIIICLCINWGLLSVANFAVPKMALHNASPPNLYT